MECRIDDVHVVKVSEERIRTMFGRWLRSKMGKQAVVGYLLKHAELVSPGAELAGIGVPLQAGEGAPVWADLMLRKGRIYYVVGAEDSEGSLQEARQRVLQLAGSLKTQLAEAKLNCDVIVPVVALAST